MAGCWTGARCFSESWVGAAGGLHAALMSPGCWRNENHEVIKRSQPPRLSALRVRVSPPIKVKPELQEQIRLALMCCILEDHAHI